MIANSGAGIGADLKEMGLPDYLFSSVTSVAGSRCGPVASAARNRIAVPCRCWRKHFWARMTLCIRSL